MFSVIANNSVLHIMVTAGPSFIKALFKTFLLECYLHPTASTGGIYQLICSRCRMTRQYRPEILFTTYAGRDRKIAKFFNVYLHNMAVAEIERSLQVLSTTVLYR